MWVRENVNVQRHLEEFIAEIKRNRFDVAKLSVKEGKIVEIPGQRKITLYYK